MNIDVYHERDDLSQLIIDLYSMPIREIILSPGIDYYSEQL